MAATRLVKVWTSGGTYDNRGFKYCGCSPRSLMLRLDMNMIPT
ncbi:uncharacterized protein G2W53_031446 [Senna tora]|uniref:Uncharacterized protein n=1 Tax=Senna tora TaxID=362788 RepID=A0A834WCI2_9FABA|nr:uncharacterized protein G2W53_031446 [Senna tora]